MSVLRGKNILLGVSGGIAAYKTAALVRLLVKSGARVRVVMTPAARDFVTPLTLSTLSNNPVHWEFYSLEEGSEWNNHVEMGLWADLMIIAPATANTLSKMATGNCDNLLVACYLSAKCPVYFAPAMDLDMYKHPSTLESLESLKNFGNIVIPAAFGELASGLVGEGRMTEPEDIVSFIQKDIESRLPLRGKKILVTAGPTHEAIDPVRFIGNHSSGKMGFDIANEAASQGAQVVLVSGPVSLSADHPGIELVRVTSAQQMLEACQKHFPDCDAAVAAAAVADFRPVTAAPEKIKKDGATMEVMLEKTTDILAWMGTVKQDRFLVGFALETENEYGNAVSKIKKKNLDLIVLNSLRDQGSGFGHPTNKVTFIDRELRTEAMELKSKEAVARDLIAKIAAHYE